MRMKYPSQNPQNSRADGLGFISKNGKRFCFCFWDSFHHRALRNCMKRETGCLFSFASLYCIEFCRGRKIITHIYMNHFLMLSFYIIQNLGHSMDTVIRSQLKSPWIPHVSGPVKEQSLHTFWSRPWHMLEFEFKLLGFCRFSYSVFSVSLNTFTSCSPMAFAESVVDDYLTYYAEEKSSWSEVWEGMWMWNPLV